MTEEHRTSDDLATRLARAIFAAGDMPNDKAHRIQFMGGTWPDHETNLGGLCEESLADLIRRHL